MQYDFIVKIVMNTFGLKKIKLFESFKNDTNVLIVLSIFPNDNFLSGNFPNVQFPKRKLPKDYVRPYGEPQSEIGPSAAAGTG